MAELQENMEKITQKIKSEKSINGVSLFQHLEQILYKIMYEPSKFSENINLFEILSDYIKKNAFLYKNPLSDQEVNNIRIKDGELTEYVNKCQQLVQNFKRKQKNMNILFPSFLSDSQMLEWAGVSFGEEETIKIQMSLQKLSEQSKATELRFWGKILCSGKDYYIAEGITSALNADTVPVGSESKGEGVNIFFYQKKKDFQFSHMYTYFVTHCMLEDWAELPLITPEQICQARQLKYIFTGDLNAQITGYPKFNGKEKHLLKAQIVRISTATVLCPRGLYKVNDDNQRVIEFEEEPFKMATDYAEIKTLDYWVHLQPAVLGIGRTTHWVSDSLNEEEKEAKKAELEEKDPEIERLRGIAEEKSPFWKEGDEEEQPNWIIREYGDTQQFNLIGKDEGNVGCYGIISLKNQTWPGAQLVCSSKGWTNIYVGFANKVNQSPFQPVWPENVQGEGEDQDEFPEPNPSQPIEELEPDSDDEGKEKEEGDEDQ